MMLLQRLLDRSWVALVWWALPLAQALAAGSGPAEPLVRYDLTHLEKLDLSDIAQRRQMWDELHLVVSLQGLVNRDAPRLFLRFAPKVDDFWWEQMTGQGGWLAGRPVETVTGLDALLRRFDTFYRGAVVWDERVPATSNLASTIAGCDQLLCLRYDPQPGSLYSRLVSGAAPLTVAVRLLRSDGQPLFTGQGQVPDTAIASSGSAKCDAYLWLIEHYLKAGKTDPLRLGYYLDAFWLTCYAAAAPQNHTLPNHDFVIARRGFVFDLNVWDDEVCVDDPGQPPGTDVATLKAILRAAYDRSGGDVCMHAAGFVPWAYKYTDSRSDRWSAGGGHAPVPTEWRYAEILSCFNAFMDADAIGLGAMANASFYQHYPLQEHYPQNPRPTRETLQARGILDASGRIVPRRYVAHYVGDYDSAAWLHSQLPRMWNDPARGSVPLSWAFNPNLCERFPLGMAWARERRTENDFFVAGDSGAGYLNPGFLTPPRTHSGLPSGLSAWERHCQHFFRQWDISLTGFVIDGYAPGLSPEGLDAYARFSPDGIVAQKIEPLGVHNGMPFLRMGGDLPAGPREAAQMLYRGTQGSLPRFGVFRSILRTPTWYAAVQRELEQIAGDEVCVVDLYTLLWLVREYDAHRDDFEHEDFQHAAEVSARPQVSHGLDVVYVEDGLFTIEQVDGRDAWQLSAGPGTRYLYVDVATSFLRSGRGPLDVEIEYADTGQTRFSLEYDSTDATAPFSGAYKPHPQVVTTHATGAAATAVFHLADPRFRGAQNGMADFRFVCQGDPLSVYRVTVRRAPAGDSSVQQGEQP